MIKLLVLAGAFALCFAGLAAETPPAGAAAPAATASTPILQTSGLDKESQHARMKSLQATCNKRADAHKLVGETRKAFVAKCVTGK